MGTSADEWDNKIRHHPPSSPNVIAAHERARAVIGAVGREFIELLPPGDETENALATLQLALMHANMAIALHHPDNLVQDTASTP